MKHARVENGRWTVDGDMTLDLEVSLDGSIARFDMRASVRRPPDRDDRIAFRVEIRCKENIKGDTDKTCKVGANAATKTYVFDNKNEPETWKNFYRWTPTMRVGPIPPSSEKIFFFEVYVRPYYPEGDGIIAPGGVGQYRVYDITCDGRRTSLCFFNAAVPSGTGG